MDWLPQRHAPRTVKATRKKREKTIIKTDFPAYGMEDQRVM